MKIILLEDVKKVGKKGELVEVKDGYGRNVLLRKNLGVEATQQAINDLKLQKKAEEKRRQEELEEAKILGEKLKELSINVFLKTGDGGRVFGSISTKEIAKEAQKQLGLELDKKKMVLDDAIRSLGTHVIPIKLHAEVTSELKVKVLEQK